jgi:hypothetical protein
MKTLLLLLSAVCASVLSACASSSSPESPAAPSVDAPHSSQVWRLDHELTAEWQAENPQPEFEQARSDTPAGVRPPRTGLNSLWTLNDAIVKLTSNGSFAVHFMINEGNAFSLHGQWTRQSVTEGTLIELDPKPSTQFSHLSLSPTNFVDSCVILIDESNQRMRLMAIGQPDIILTRIP